MEGASRAAAGAVKSGGLLEDTLGIWKDAARWVIEPKYDDRSRRNQNE